MNSHDRASLSQLRYKYKHGKISFTQFHLALLPLYEKN